MKIHVEVFIASRILGQRQGTFTPEELKKFILTEFNDSRSGVQTHVTAECVANAPLNHALGHNYLWRTEHGILRVFKPGFDHPSRGREKSIDHPWREDMPEKYLYLLAK